MNYYEQQSGRPERANSPMTDVEVPSPKQIRDMRAVPVALDRLSSVCGTYGGLLEALEKRLSPVLRPRRAEKEDRNKPMSATENPVLVKALDALADRWVMQNEALAALIERLEV